MSEIPAPNPLIEADRALDRVTVAYLTGPNPQNARTDAFEYFGSKLSYARDLNGKGAGFAQEEVAICSYVLFEADRGNFEPMKDELIRLSHEFADDNEFEDTSRALSNLADSFS